MQTAKIEKLAFTLLLLFMVTVCITVLTKAFTILAPGLTTDSPIYSAFTIQTKVFSTIYSIFRITIPIGSAVWLYISNKGSSTKWLWALLGLFSGVFALILFYIYQVNLTLQKDGIRGEQIR
jgi:hypothetical protein